MTVAKIGAPDECISSFLGSLIELCKAKGVHKDGVSLFAFPGHSSLASKCVGSLKLFLRVKLQVSK